MGKNIFSRRSFLKTSAAIAALQLAKNQFAFAEQTKNILENKNQFDQTPSMDTLYDCIVIGAGAAGITAARELAASRGGKNNYRVLVLEGSSRIGGRVHTLHDANSVNDFGKPLELGAEYIHVNAGSAPIWDEISRYGIQTTSLPKIMRGYLYDPHAFPKGAQAPLHGDFNWDLLGANHVFSDIDKYAGPDISGREFIRGHHYEGLQANSADMILSGHMPASLDDISIQGFQADSLTAQLQVWNENAVDGGYDSILTNMIREIGPANILLNHPVSQIVPSADGEFISANVPGVGWFTARTMLCSVAIGALHARKIDFGKFWTSEKEESLRFIVPGHHTKVSIRFADKFWPLDMSMLNYIDAATRKAGKTYFVPNYEDYSLPPVLTALIMGDEAKRLQSFSDDEVLRVICSDLDRVFPEKASIYSRIARRANGAPQYCRKQWMDDPFSLGGNSFLRVNEAGASVNIRNARRTLASSKTTKPLFWAGEATEFTLQPGSVHGAHSSGIRAAAEIRAFLS